MFARRRRGVRLFVAATTLSVSLSVGGGGAQALACDVPTPEEAFRQAPIIFIGRVVEPLAHPEAAERVGSYRVQVIEPIKGTIGSEVLLGVGWEPVLMSAVVAVLPNARPQLFMVRRTSGTMLASAVCGGFDTGRALALVRGFREALAVADRAVAERPNDVLPLLGRAAILSDWGDLDRAERDYADAARIAPDIDAVLLGQARTQFSRGRYLEVIGTLSRARGNVLASADARFLVEQARLRTGDTDVPVEFDLSDLRVENVAYGPGRDLDLQHRVLSRSSWSQVFVERLHLTGSRLDRARVFASTIGIIRASGVDFEGAEFEQSTFILRAPGARLRGARFRVVALQIADLADADVRGAHFDDVHVQIGMFARGAQFQDSQIRQLQVVRGNFPAARFDGAVVDGSSFWASDFADASFAGARVEATTFGHSDFERTDFRRADLSGSRFLGVTFDGAEFGGARLDRTRFAGSRFHGVDLSQANLTSADLNGSRYDCATRFPADFAPMRRGAIPIDAACRPVNEWFVFDGADFRGTEVDLSDLDLSGASFRGVVFGRRGEPYGARLSGSNLRGADFTGSTGLSVHGVTDLRGADFTGATDAWGFYAGRGEPAKDLTGAVFRGVRFHPGAFAGFEGDRPADLSQALMEGAILICTRLDQQPEMRARWVAWIRALEPRRRGIILGEGCDRVPELADVR